MDRSRQRPAKRDVHSLLHNPRGQHHFANGGGCLLLYETLEVLVTSCSSQQPCSRRINISSWWVALRYCRLLFCVTPREKHTHEHTCCYSHRPGWRHWKKETQSGTASSRAGFKHSYFIHKKENRQHHYSSSESKTANYCLQLHCAHECLCVLMGNCVWV